MKKIMALVLTASIITAGCGFNVAKYNNIEEAKIETKLLGAVKDDKSYDREYRTNLSAEGKLEITSRPESYSIMSLVEKWQNINRYDPDSKVPWQVDLRNSNIENIDLKDRYYDLIHANFDTETKWPEELPEGFDPEQIMELGKDPGLGIRELHKRGITGKGVGIAIIDQNLLVDHEEYGDRLKMYEEIHNTGDNIAMMHGTGVASIAAGESVGVAPEADLYYIACTPGTYSGVEFKPEIKWLAKSIDRVVQVNKSLPDSEKIRVISISLAFDSDIKEYEEIAQSIVKAERDGIHVINVKRLPFWGLGRGALDDPNNPASYTEADFCRKRPEFGRGEGMVHIPIDARTTAAPNGNDDYVYYSEGGLSWAAPYVAGLYALACQVDPDMNPGKFWDLALETGDKVEFYDDSVENPGVIVNPEKLMETAVRNYPEPLF